MHLNLSLKRMGWYLDPYTACQFDRSTKIINVLSNLARGIFCGFVGFEKSRFSLWCRELIYGSYGETVVFSVPGDDIEDQYEIDVGEGGIISSSWWKEGPVDNVLNATANSWRYQFSRKEEKCPLNNFIYVAVDGWNVGHWVWRLSVWEEDIAGWVSWVSLAGSSLLVHSISGSKNKVHDASTWTEESSVSADLPAPDEDIDTAIERGDSPYRSSSPILALPHPSNGPNCKI